MQEYAEMSILEMVRIRYLYTSYGKGKRGNKFNGKANDFLERFVDGPIGE